MSIVTGTILRRSMSAAAAVVIVATTLCVGGGAAIAIPTGVGRVDVDPTRPGHTEVAWSEVDGASSYTVRRDGIVLITADTLRYDDTNAAPGSNHVYAVTASVNGAAIHVGRRSVSIPPQLDHSAPSAVTGLAVTSTTDTSVGLSWSASSDDVDVVAYLVFSGGIRVAFSEGKKTVTVKNLKSSTGYTFTVRALDAAGNLGSPGTISATTSASSDTAAPSTPQGVKATAYSSNEIDLTWGASTDGHSLAGYLIFRSDQTNPLADIPVAHARVYEDTSVTPGTTYGYRVQAYDSAGNPSAKSLQSSVAPLGSGVVQVVRGPLAQQADRSSAQITWRTNIPAPSQLQYTAGGVTTQVTDPVDRTQHAVLISGLPANSTITYSITYTTDARSGSFRTCGRVGDPSNIDVVGDFGGGGTPEKDIANEIAADNPDFVMSTGDNVYPAGEDVDYPARFFKPYQSAFSEAAFWTAFGNHDYYDPGGVASHLNLTQPNTESWFSFNCSSMHVLVLDTEIPYGPGSPQYQFAKTDLASATAPWKIVVLHRPPYSSLASSTDAREDYQPLFEQYGVQMVFSGHSHNYERSVPINGVTYVVTGGGGNGLNAFTGTQPSFSAFRAAEYHYVRVGVTSTSLAVTARRRDGTTLDLNTVNRTGDITAPGAPRNLHVTATDASSVSLAWNTSTDNIGVAGYRIFRDGSLLTEIGAQTTFTDSGLSANTAYHYDVRAFDAAKNTSAARGVDGTTGSSGPDVQPPTVPGNLHTIASSPGDVEFGWDASTDNVQVARYDVFRDGQPIGSTPAGQRSFIDTAPQAGESHLYRVRALDISNLQSDLSSPLTISVSSAVPLFSDNFEGGSLSRWTTVNGLAVTQGITAPSGGQWVARETSTGAGATYAYTSISPTATDLFARFRFDVLSRDGGVELMRFRNGANGSKFTLLIDSSTGKLTTRNANGVSTKSNTVISTGQWYTVEVHVKIGSPSTTEVWLNGTLVPELGATGDLGTTNFGQFLLGQTAASGTYDVAFDDVIVSKIFT